MATINFRFEEKEKDILKNEAVNLGYSNLSRYVVDLIKARPTNKKIQKKPKILKPKVSSVEKAVVRITADEKIKLQNFCYSEGESISAVLRRQIRILINNEPHCGHAEMIQLVNKLFCYPINNDT